jgi:hypothetical protein
MSDFRVAETNTVTPTKIKAAAKQEVMDYLTECLKERYGEDNVGFVRVGNGQSKTKELAIRMGIVEAGGEECEMCVTMNVTGKDYRDRTTSKGDICPAFNFNIMTEEYNIYLGEKEAKAKDAKTKKDKKIAKDKEQREKKVNFEDF